MSGIDRSGRHRGALSGFGIEAPLVGVRLAIEKGEDEEHDAANEGNESNEVPPAAFADVVKAADGDSQTWDHDHEGVGEQESQRKHGGLFLCAEGDSKKNQEEEYDAVEQIEVPVFLAARAAAEVGGTLPGEYEPGHVVLSGDADSVRPGPD